MQQVDAPGLSCDGVGSRLLCGIERQRWLHAENVVGQGVAFDARFIWPQPAFRFQMANVGWRGAKLPCSGQGDLTSSEFQQQPRGNGLRVGCKQRHCLGLHGSGIARWCKPPFVARPP